MNSKICTILRATLVYDLVGIKAKRVQTRPMWLWFIIPSHGMSFEGPNQELPHWHEMILHPTSKNIKLHSAACRKLGQFSLSCRRACNSSLLTGKIVAVEVAIVAKVSRMTAQAVAMLAWAVLAGKK